MKHSKLKREILDRFADKAHVMQQFDAQKRVVAATVVSWIVLLTPISLALALLTRLAR